MRCARRRIAVVVEEEATLFMHVARRVKTAMDGVATLDVRAESVDEGSVSVLCCGLRCTNTAAGAQAASE